MAIGDAGLTRDDSSLIGFVVSSLFCSAIDLEEFRDWVYEVIRTREAAELPGYMFDLADFDGPAADLSSIIGFVPSWDGSRQQEGALYGIAAKRGRERYEWPVPKVKALRLLEQHPEIEEKFRKTFATIKY